MFQTLKKYLLLFAGSLFLIIGVIGIFLPILPTTPLFLLSAYCYLRSSKRLYNWLIHHRVFGIYIYNYLTYKAVPQKTKIQAIIFLWITISISIIFLSNMYIRILLFIIASAVSIHILSLKTLRLEDLKVDELKPSTEELE